MNYYTKRKLKNWFKEKWKILLGSGIFLSIGLTVMLIGFSVTGWSLIKWLKSPFATTTFIFVIGGILLFIFAIFLKKQADLIK